MARAETSKQFKILLGDGASPEVFAWPCGANTRSASFTKEMSEETLLDCLDPLGAPSSTYRSAISQDTSLSIAGKIAMQAWPVWREFVDGDESRNIQIVIDEPLAKGGGYWTIAAHLSSFEINAEGKDTMSFTAELVGDGPRAWTDAAA